MISVNEILNPSYYKVFRVYGDSEIKNHFKRRGFDLIGEVGDGTKSKIEFTFYGDHRKLTKQELPFIEFYGKLKKKKEFTYGKA